MDTADIVAGLLVVLAGAGIYYLLQHRTPPVPMRGEQKSGGRPTAI
jgi:hypothetical protein